MKQLQIVTAVCAFRLFIAQVKAEDLFLVEKRKAYAFRKRMNYLAVN